MSWTIPQLKAAYAALSPTPATAADACAALNGQTTTGVYVDVPAATVRNYLLQTGEWGGLLNEIAAAPTSTTATVQAIIRSLQTSAQEGVVFGTSASAIRSDVSGWLAALQSAGLITSSSVTALEAMWGPFSLPVWSPPITPADLQTAGIIS